MKSRRQGIDFCLLGAHCTRIRPPAPRPRPKQALMSRILLFLATLCLLPSCVFVLNDMERAYETRDFQFDGAGIRLVEIDSYNGRVTLDHNSTGDGSVTCTARFYASGKSETIAQDRLAEMTVEAERDGDVLRIKVPPHSELGTNNAGARLDLELPEGVLIDLRTSNGSVEMDAAFHQPVIRSSNGSILVRALSGPIKVRTSNGRIDIHDWAAPGKVEAKTSNGGIDYLGASMDFELVTSNGPVHVELPADWNGKGYVHSSNGSVHIKSDGRLQADLRASTFNGKVTIDGPSMEGEGVLTVETSNGPVRVSHGG